MKKDTRKRAEAYLASCPDKSQDKATISMQFKRDMLDFMLYGRDGTATCLEMGTSAGHTTQLLSIVCARVVTVDNILSNTTSVQGLGLSNVDAVVGDLYGTKIIMSSVNKIEKQLQELGPFTVSFIDAVHTYHHCLSDAKMSLRLGCDALIFDDTGLFDGVNSAYQKVINTARGLKIRVSTRPMGHLPGAHAHGDKTFKRPEGELIEFIDMTPVQRETLLRRLDRVDRMSELSCSTIDRMIQRVVDSQMKNLEAWVIKSNDPELIQTMHERPDLKQSTAQHCMNVIIDALHTEMGQSYDCLPNESLSDVLNTLNKISEEFDVSPVLPINKEKS